jgi:hypothetical protein
MPSVFTIYNCGTGFNRQRLDELTANLASRTEGYEFRDWMINDGPGSTPVDPSKGRAPKDDERPASAQEKILQAKATKPGLLAKIRGIGQGYGWHHNVQRAITNLERLDEIGEKPLVVNLLGWSRGGITCHMIAWAMAKHPSLRSIRTNVFAIDPVAGPGNKGDWDKGRIPATVSEYASVLMEDERRWIMTPSVVAPHGAGGSRHLNYPMPGAHNTGVMIHQGPVGEIVQHLAHNFLSRHGTTLSSPIRLSPNRLVELYAMVRLTLEEYQATFSGKHGGALQVVGVHRRQGDIANTERDTIYINHHHRTMFKAAYPAIANLSMAKNLGDYKAQVANLASSWPATHAWLTKVAGLA